MPKQILGPKKFLMLLPLLIFFSLLTNFMSEIINNKLFLILNHFLLSNKFSVTIIITIMFVTLFSYLSFIITKNVLQAKHLRKISDLYAIICCVIVISACFLARCLYIMISQEFQLVFKINQETLSPVFSNLMLSIVYTAGGESLFKITALVFPKIDKLDYSRLRLAAIAVKNLLDLNGKMQVEKMESPSLIESFDRICSRLLDIEIELNRNELYEDIESEIQNIEKMRISSSALKQFINNVKIHSRYENLIYFSKHDSPGGLVSKNVLEAKKFFLAFN
ncbi:MAG: hypothetical protein NT166_23330 [Candidatus Aminicenantes bacterium]|nr:hypothetical protein [Candidatus Aminicenantes bacterium]